MNRVFGFILKCIERLLHILVNFLNILTRLVVILNGALVRLTKKYLVNLNWWEKHLVYVSTIIIYILNSLKVCIILSGDYALILYYGVLSLWSNPKLLRNINIESLSLLLKISLRHTILWHVILLRCMHGLWVGLQIFVLALIDLLLLRFLSFAIPWESHLRLRLHDLPHKCAAQVLNFKDLPWILLHPVCVDTIHNDTFQGCSRLRLRIDAHICHDHVDEIILTLLTVLHLKIHYWIFIY